MQNKYTVDTKKALKARSLLVLLSCLVLSLVFIPVIDRLGMFQYPEYNPQGDHLAVWVMKNSVLPSTVLFIVALVTGWYVLTLANNKYVLWIAKNAYMDVIKSYLMMLLLTVAMYAVILSTSIDSAFFIPTGRVTSFQGTMLLITLSFTVVFPLWLGYRTSWKTYVGDYKKPHKVSGTMSKQDQYEEYLQYRETLQSGQFYDKFVVLVVHKMLGSDGSKPRGFTLWATMSTLLSVPFIMSSIGLYTSNEVTLSLFLFFILPSLLLLFIYLSKSHDMRTYKRLPYLYPKRGYEDIDMNYYDPASLGVKKFKRD